MTLFTLIIIFKVPWTSEDPLYKFYFLCPNKIKYLSENCLNVLRVRCIGTETGYGV